jgi:hypothetical protein
MLVSPDDAIDQITRLERTIGFVKGEEGIAWRNRLVDGLLNACNAHSVGPKPIIDRCLELSKHCPTDFDLHTVAGIIREEMRSQQKAPGLNSPRCNKCNGTGWERVFALHTKEGEGEFTYKRRERITQQVYESLHGRLGPNQETYTGVRRCDHAKVEPEWTLQQRQEHDAKWAAFIAEPRNRKLLRSKFGAETSEKLGA